MSKYQLIQRDFVTGRPVWDSKFLSQINEKPLCQSNFNGFFSTAMPNIVNNYLIIKLFLTKNS